MAIACIPLPLSEGAQPSTPNTPLALALWDLFRGLDAVLRAAGAPAASVRVYGFGNAAVLLRTRVRVSDDVDVEFESQVLGRRQVLLASSRSCRPWSSTTRGSAA